MTDHLRIDVNDQITGYCPPCREPEVELAYDTGIGRNGRYEEQRYVLRCAHQDVCLFRREFMGRD
jgi:hypothetical protein